MKCSSMDRHYMIPPSNTTRVVITAHNPSATGESAERFYVSIEDLDKCDGWKHRNGTAMGFDSWRAAYAQALVYYTNMTRFLSPEGRRG